MDNSKIIQLLNTTDTHHIAMILLATDKILKKQFVEHLVFVVLKEVFNPKKQLIGTFINHYYHNFCETFDTFSFSSNWITLGYKAKVIRYKYKNIYYDLCNPEECVKIMKLLENVAYSYIDWWYKYYITKELK